MSGKYIFCFLILILLSVSSLTASETEAEIKANILAQQQKQQKEENKKLCLTMATMFKGMAYTLSPFVENLDSIKGKVNFFMAEKHARALTEKFDPSRAKKFVEQLIFLMPELERISYKLGNKTIIDGFLKIKKWVKILQLTWKDPQSPVFSEPLPTLPEKRRKQKRRKRRRAREYEYEDEDEDEDEDDEGWVPPGQRKKGKRKWKKWTPPGHRKGKKKGWKKKKKKKWEDDD
ncbi:hypothetical protein ACFL35_09615 [Candidatus Riflebacteria bacterium]